MEKKEKYTFEQAMQKLEEIVAKLESGETPLEETIQLFQEGMELINFCNKKLEEVKHKVEMVVRTKNGYNLVPFQQNNSSLNEQKQTENFRDYELDTDDDNTNKFPF